MERERFDAILRRLHGGTSRRCAVRNGIGVLATPVAVLLGLTRSEGAWAKSGKCKKTCGECERCKKGNCKKQNGKKRCKRGKCQTKTDGTLCSGGTCQNGDCASPPSPACPGPGNTSISGSRRFAQTFFSQFPGQLTSAQFEVTNLAGGEDFVLEIRGLNLAEQPDIIVLASATIDNVPATPVSQARTLTATIAPPLAVAANQILALVVTVGMGQSFFLRVRSNDACPGEFFMDDNANETWVPLADIDMIFATTIV